MLYGKHVNATEFNVNAVINEISHKNIYSTISNTLQRNSNAHAESTHVKETKRNTNSTFTNTNETI